ncbi:MAG TPA: FAD-dependent oxidoreductase [Pseudonocardiaceae bacterium]|jgi:protoporphyrinogen oxidase|nr:FAD-dependent oxidoreductase [Pseudonocardiaceae bacterium]
MNDVTVVGGGLAGMTAAWEIRKLGLDVRLLEAAPELGGMAGTRVIDGRPEDHGVHIFPAWYRNALGLLADLDLLGNLRECDNFYQLMPGEFPNFRTFRSLFTLGDFIKDIRSGVTSTADRLLFYYGLIDLLSQDYAGRDESLSRFLRSRWYLTETAIADIEHLFVASSAAESDLASAASFRGSIAAFSRHPGNVRMPKGTLQDTLVAPFRAKLTAAGVDIRTDTELTAVSVREGRVDAITLAEAEPVTGHVVLAIPHGRLAGLDLDLGVEELSSRPLGALHVYLRRRLPGLPDEHVRLVSSPHAITLIDVGQVWPGQDASLLNCVVGRVSRLATMSPDEASKVLVEELMTYLPAMTWDDVEHVCYQPHFAEPFFVPGPGFDAHRPVATTALANLHLAGDFCAAPPGVAGMEGAIRSGLAAAESVRRALRPDASPVRILDFDPVAPGGARVLRRILAPVAAITRLVAR